jgi:uncharacterized protein
MDIDSYDEGVPSWVDLGTPDPAAAAAFYGGLFGWECPEGPPEAGGYRVCTLRGRAVAGIGPQMGPGPAVWTTYINVADADATAGKVTEAGGSVLAPPFDVMDAGRMGVFADTDGAAFAVWQPNGHPGAQVVNETGALSWNELMTADTDAAMAFYPAVFGWEVGKTPPEGPLAYAEWKVDGRSIGGLLPRPEGLPPEVPSYWGVYFVVDDTDAALGEVTRLGGSILMGATDIPQGRFAVVADHTGTPFNIIALAAG